MVCWLFRNDARVLENGMGLWSNDEEQRGTHLLDGVLKFNVVLCDFTVEIFQE